MRILTLGVEFGAGGSGRGWLNAPVLAFCNFSKSACSSFGRRGGAGLRLKGEAAKARAEEVIVRRESWRGTRAAMVRRGDDIVIVWQAKRACVVFEKTQWCWSASL